MAKRKLNTIVLGKGWGSARLDLGDTEEDWQKRVDWEMQRIEKVWWLGSWEGDRPTLLFHPKYLRRGIGKMLPINLFKSHCNVGKQAMSSFIGIVLWSSENCVTRTWSVFEHGCSAGGSCDQHTFSETQGGSQEVSHLNSCWWFKIKVNPKYDCYN